MENRKLTICFFGEAEPADIHTVKWAKYFSDKGHNVHLFSYSDFGNNRVKEINLHLLKKKFSITLWPLNTLLNMPFTIKSVKKLLKEIKPDIVHAHCVTSYGTLASKLGFHPFILTAWGSDILVNPKKFLPSEWTAKYALKKADLITCDAEHMKKAVMEFGVPENKIKIINFGIDTVKFSPGKKDEELIKELEISDSKTIISLRGLAPIYSVDTLIKAIPLVSKEIPDTKFFIAGKGSREEELKKLARELGIINNIKFIGWIPNEELPRYLRMVDVYVSTSLSDGGIASSTAEAMACALPVIITDTGDNRKWVKDGEGGFIIPTKNPEILAEKIIYLLENENLRKEMGKNGRKIIEERNDYYKEMAKMEEIYYQLTQCQFPD